MSPLPPPPSDFLLGVSIVATSTVLVGAWLLGDAIVAVRCAPLLILLEHLDLQEAHHKLLSMSTGNKLESAMRRY